MQLERDKPYRRADALTVADFQELGLTLEECRTQPVIMAVWTGEKRAPKAGEWYLSGMTIAAYRARFNLTTEFPIARLVRAEERNT